MVTNSKAQQNTHYFPSGKDKAKTISGQYGDNSGICLFEDGKFLLYGYATSVFGSYVFEKDYLLFYPDEAPRFQLYGRYSPNISASVCINLVGFEGGETFVQIDNDSTQRVFNEKANCFSPPYIHQESKPIQSLKFIVQNQHVEQDSAYQVFQYTNEGEFNDFIAAYNKPQRARQNFSAYLYLAEDNKLAIRLSNYGGERGFLRESQRGSNQEHWHEILRMKEEYDGANYIDPMEIYSNASYTIFYPDLEQYILDPVTKRYVSKFASDNEAYFTNNPGQDDRYLNKYIRQNLLFLKDERFDLSKLPTTSLFFSSCEEPEKSYQYRKDQQP
jgi:hypothetical protein